MVGPSVTYLRFGHLQSVALTSGSLSELGYGLLFAWVFAEQAGLPIPAAPFLVATGALAANGKLHFGLAILVGLAGSLFADMAWYEAGRYRGLSLIRSLCRISVEKDSCSRRAQVLYGRFGAFVLVIAKFVPGLNFVAPPLSGVFQMKRWRFVLFDATGALAWVTVYTSLGFFFGTQLTTLVRKADVSTKTLAVLGFVAATSVFMAWKVHQRRRFNSQLRAALITPEGLKTAIDLGAPLTIIDVRHPLDLFSHPFVIPNAIRIPLETIEARSSELSQDHELVIYCTCPNQASSSMALQRLRRYGFSRVRVLSGGLQAWRDKGFEVQQFEFNGTEKNLIHPIWTF
jgi:membrane protein DedA with SNARE-associated domain/rhodanese-related sulfurtransferase